MQFAYHARDAGGTVRAGEISAAGSAEAALQLRQDGLYVLSLEEAEKTTRSRTQSSLLPKRVTRNDVVYFTNQLAIMVDAGVPLAQALDGIGRQVENATLRNVLEQVRKGVESGEDLSAALARHPRIFDETYVNLVKASEASGTLPRVLERIGTQMRAEFETRQKVRGAMVYPAAMLLMCVGVSVFLLVYVFPKLVPMFATRSIDVPTPTRIVMALSDALVHRWYAFVAGAGLLAAGWWKSRHQRWYRTARDWAVLTLPILGPVLQKVAISRSLRTLATTVNAGVPMLESIELCAGVSNNVYFRRCWEDVAEQVAGGHQIHESLQGHGLFPPTLLQMVGSGETTGKLGEVLNKVSDYYDREVENAIKSATSLIEPLMVFAMGGIIGTLALAMLLPIFQLSASH